MEFARGYVFDVRKPRNVALIVRVIACGDNAAVGCQPDKVSAARRNFDHVPTGNVNVFRTAHLDASVRKQYRREIVARRHRYRARNAAEIAVGGACARRGHCAVRMQRHNVLQPCRNRRNVVESRNVGLTRIVQSRSQYAPVGSQAVRSIVTCGNRDYVLPINDVLFPVNLTSELNDF